ncbi:MAG TPA: glycoside hydrolase family 2 TIM barrel-domain containing protein [Chloroflexia bacterium]|nr:glycoside hydrolase family 2 TIM barrel-domain containing protein [Chloroflexia bacterium]
MDTAKTTIQPLSGWWRLFDDNVNEWQWSKRSFQKHDLSDWRRVKVPGSIQEALWQLGEIKHPYHNLASRQAEWVEHRDWIYALDFSVECAALAGNRRIFLEFEAVTDRCAVYLNGAYLGQHEGPGAPFNFEITGKLNQAGTNQLQVVINPPLPEDPQIGHTEHTRSLRGRMGFGWDFAPRLVNLGILGEVNLHFTGGHHLRDLRVRSELFERHEVAELALEVMVDGPGGAGVNFEVLFDGQVVSTTRASAGEDGYARAALSLAKPHLWWPNGMGEQALYTVRASCEDDSDRLESSIGFRNLKWLRQPGAAGHEWPLALMVNGVAVFQRGWNWVPADSLGGPGALRKMKKLVKLAREAHVNVLRCWGGGDPESKAFYEECDRLGLLVWQEFPLSSSGLSNLPPDDAEYLERLDNYAREVVKVRRNHPSLALWSGGNELTFSSGQPLTMEHLLPQHLAAVVQTCDPDRAFRPSSPLGPNFGPATDDSEQWDVHGPWIFSEDPPGPNYELINNISPLLHSELGLPSETDLSEQKKFLSPKYRERHPANRARRHHKSDWWEHQEVVEALFGREQDDELAILASQWLQAEGLRYYIEESRRRWPHTTGIYPWQLNEPWPTTVCTSAVQYSGKPKLAYYAIKGAYQPLAITARYNGLTFQKGQPLCASIWVVNEQADLRTELIVSLGDLKGAELQEKVVIPARVEASSATCLYQLEAVLPAEFSGVAVLDLALGNLASNRYLFSNQAAYPLRELLQYPGVLKSMFKASSKEADLELRQQD